MGDGGRSTQNHVHNIEPDFIPGNFGVAGIVPCRAQHVAEFFGSNGTVGSSKLFGLPGLYFNENQRLLIPSNQIDFSRARLHPVISGHDNCIIKAPFRFTNSTPILELIK